MERGLGWGRTQLWQCSSLAGIGGPSAQEAKRNTLMLLIVELARHSWVHCLTLPFSELGGPRGQSAVPCILLVHSADPD